MNTDNVDSDPITEKELKIISDELKEITNNINNLIFGQQKVVNLVLITLLSGGHALILGLPGLAKTRLANCLGHVLGLSRNRIQFTPDLMPSDIIGTEILDESTSKEKSFRFII